VALLGHGCGVEGVVTTVDEADSWVGRTAIDRTGRKIGRITRVWIDDHSGQPAWATIDTGRIRRCEAVAPLASVTASGVHQQLACRRAEVRRAPSVQQDGHLELDDEWRLFTHYKLVGASDPTRQEPASQLPVVVRGLTTGPAPGPRLGSATSKRVFLADIRRTLRLG